MISSVSIPTELILEILSRLPSKSIARFHCVSKLWASLLVRPYFTKLFLTRSSAQPRLLFAIEEKGQWSIFSLPQHLCPYEKSSSSSLVVAAEFHMKFPPEGMKIYRRDHRQFACGYASGLIYFYGMCIKHNFSGVPVICNPKTGRYETLPYIDRYRKSYSFVGFDPVGKQFKVLFMAYPYCCDDHRIMTIGTREMRWRKIECSVRHVNVSEGICINGVLYYLGGIETSPEEMPYDLVIVCFDVRSETFKFIYPESLCELINYKGKLGVVYYDDYAGDAIELRVWVLEDVKKQEWSKYVYTLRDDKFLLHKVSVVGVISTGEIVLSMGDYTSKKPFYVFYFNPERNTHQRVEIQGFGVYHEVFDNPSRVHVFVDDCSRFYAFADQAEDLSVNDQKLLKSSIYAPYTKDSEEESEEEYDDDEGFRCFYGFKKKKKKKEDEDEDKEDNEMMIDDEDEHKEDEDEEEVEGESRKGKMKTRKQEVMIET